MSRGASLSLLGLYNWDNSLFDTMVVPDGFTTEDTQLLINNILMDCAELEVLYSNWDFMKDAIAVWSAKEVITWNRIYSASLLEYNPIENYNRTEETTRQRFGKVTNSGKDTNQSSGTDTNQASGTDTNQASGNDMDVSSSTDSMSRSGTDTDTTSKTSYENIAYAPTEKIEHANGTLETYNKSGTVTHTNGRKDEYIHGRKDEYTHGRKDEYTYGHIIQDDTGETIDSTISGNIGVTTSQQMLEQELEIAPKLNIINYIIESFKNRFCLLVY